MSINKEYIKEKLSAQFGEGILAWEESSDILCVVVKCELNLKVLTFFAR